MEIYDEDFSFVSVNEIVTFRRENILEIPDWKDKRYQPNSNVLEQEHMRILDEENIFAEMEYERNRIIKKEQLIKDNEDYCKKIHLDMWWNKNIEENTDNV